VISLDLLPKCLLIMELGFDAMLLSNLGMKIVMRAIPNVHAGRIWPASRRLPTPVIRECAHFVVSTHISLQVKQ